MEQSLLHNVQRGCRCNQLFIYQTLSSVTTNWLTDVECCTPYVYYTMPIDNKRSVRLIRCKLIRIVELSSTTFPTVLITTSINVYCFEMFYQCLSQFYLNTCIKYKCCLKTYIYSSNTFRYFK